MLNMLCFQTVRSHPSLSVVADALPQVMDSLRMVWILSRHYNRDHRMAPLMERLAWELVTRVRSAISIKTLFRWALVNDRRSVCDTEWC